ncbi:unnamed protein product [Protopolystoma xenopodis]|uniref:Uncharacterized protein n=1 Tax=Protopolystoma xenopodis TaxID=117903 RepID=A0A448XBF3_9PLAT|nr:unnamed protein product [Protopolystoma xenopodis]
MIQRSSIRRSERLVIRYFIDLVILDSTKMVLFVDLAIRDLGISESALQQKNLRDPGILYSKIRRSCFLQLTNPTILDFTSRRSVYSRSDNPQSGD